MGVVEVEGFLISLLNLLTLSFLDSHDSCDKVIRQKRDNIRKLSKEIKIIPHTAHRFFPASAWSMRLSRLGQVDVGVLLGVGGEDGGDLGTQVAQGLPGEHARIRGRLRGGGEIDHLQQVGVLQITLQRRNSGLRSPTAPRRRRGRR